jgi:hypothetical protein
MPAQPSIVVSIKSTESRDIPKGARSPLGIGSLNYATRMKQCGNDLTICKYDICLISQDKTFV